MKRKTQCDLERNLGPDPINPCADLSAIAHGLYTRMLQLAIEQERLKIQYINCMRAIDRLSTGEPL